MANDRWYAVTTSIATVTSAKTLIQVKAGATTPLYIAYIAVDGSSDTADGMDITIVRKTAAATVTDYTPLLLNQTAGTGQIAQAAASASAATGTAASSEGTDGDILWRRQGSVQSGGGVAERFGPWEIMVKATGIIGLKSNITITSATLTATLWFVEVG